MTPAHASPQPVAFSDRYWLLECIAVGGMAEIYRARQDAMAGFEKDIVIKRLKPHLARDPRMVEMFLDEARIGAALNHPNIVHVYDVGEHAGVPYIAMELIHGEELNHLCRRGLELGRFLPLHHAIELMRQAAIGMGYFHAQRDARGRDLRIIHCDISPTNLLVTQDGGLKIIDFGIARARNQKHRDHGALPGKVSYMSPEQAGRESLDHRSDIFALGVVLYEITVGKRLFKGPAETVVPRVLACDIQPPTFVHNGFPGPLEAVIMRALEKHAGDRYDSAYDLADDLEDVLRELGMRSGATRIARYLDDLHEAAGGERRPELVSERDRIARDHEDDLDFDRGLFDGYQAVEPGVEHDATEWDEYDEDTAAVAAALGVPEEQLERVGSKANVFEPADVSEPLVGYATGNISEPVHRSDTPHTNPALAVAAESSSPPATERVERTDPGESEPEPQPESPAAADAPAQARPWTVVEWVVFAWAVMATTAAVVTLFK